MLSKIQPLLGFTSRVRCYSTLGGTPTPTSTSGFLSDLMKRIDNINLKTTKIARTQALNQSGEKKQPNGVKTSNTGKPGKPGKSIKSGKRPFVPNRARQPVKANIAVKDHPLSSNMFKLMDQKNFQNRVRQINSRGAHQNGERTGQKDQNVSGSSRNQGKGNFSARQNRRQNGRPQSAGGQSFASKNVSSRKPRSTTPASIVPKKLQSAALKPALGGDQFFYGKPSKFAVSTSTRVAAVAKELLLKSNYPYRLPKSIINGVEGNVVRNRFLLQKDYKDTVDADQFQTRVKKVVRGETEELVISKNATPAQQDARRRLMENGTLPMHDKKTIYDLVAGVKSAQELLKNAAWNK